MRINFKDGLLLTFYNGEEAPVVVSMDVETRDERAATIGSLETIKQRALRVILEAARLKTFKALLDDFQTSEGAILLPGSPIFFLIKDSLTIERI